MQTRPHAILFALQQLVADLAFVERNHHLDDSERPENDIEHSFMVAMLCWYIASRNKLPLDFNKVLKYALVHDFVERYDGDVHNYAPKSSRQKKTLQEKAALAKLVSEFEDFEDLTETLQAYDKKIDKESAFVWSVDKIQALLLAYMDDWRPLKTMNITYEHFVQRETEKIEQSSPYCKEIFETLFEYCKKTYYDRRIDQVEPL